MVKIIGKFFLPEQKIEYKLRDIVISYKIPNENQLNNLSKEDELVISFINHIIKMIYFIKLNDKINIDFLWKQFNSVCKEIKSLEQNGYIKIFVAEEQPSSLYDLFTEKIKVDEFDKLIIKLNPKTINYEIEKFIKIVSKTINILSKKEFFPPYLLSSFSIKKDKQNQSNINNQSKPIETFLEYLEIIKEMGKIFPKIWYRGQSQEDYKLRPGIFRKKENFSLERKKMKYFLQNAKGYSK